MEKLLTTFKALSDGNRLRIVAALTAHNELCACQLTELLQVKGATASRHLSILTSAGITKSRKEGRWVYYSLTGDPEKRFFPESLQEWVGDVLSESDSVRMDLERLEEIIATDKEDLCRQQRGEACCPT